MRAVVLLACLASVLSYHTEIHPEYQQGLSINDVPASRRLHWMRVANEVSPSSSPSFPTHFACTRVTQQAIYADGHPCPQAPFGTAIVNTTSDELVCVISNKVGATGGTCTLCVLRS
jgi:hypothetical protein